MSFNHRTILRVLAAITLFEGIAMLPPLICSIIFHDSNTASAFFFVSICCIGFGLPVYRQLSSKSISLKTRDALLIVLISWLSVCLIGSLPYLLSNNGFSLVECIFESVSGWTTTGATVLGIDSIPKGLILWKAINNWLGGMGILVLTISIFPVLGVGGQKLAELEVTGPTFKKISARVGDTAKISYKIYVILTVIELCLLLPSGLSPFDALVNTLSSISTSGIISLRGAFDLHMTTYVKMILFIFSIVGSINFMMYYFISVGRFRKVLKTVELRTYIGLLLGSTVVIGLILTVTGTYDNGFEALKDAAIQSVSFGSTSGFTVSNITYWPTQCKIILIALVFIGGCGFSTSGGIKVIRFIVFFKITIRGIYKRIHPHAVKPVMIEKKPVSSATAASITVFILLYFAIYVSSAIVLALENVDLETTLSATLGALSNNGTGFGLMTSGNYSIFSSFGQLWSALLMLIGRLEMYPIIMLFSRSFWNSDRARS